MLCIYEILDQGYLNLLNFLFEVIHLPFLELSIIIYKDIKMIIWSWSDNIKEPGQSTWMYRLAWLYTGGKDITFFSIRKMVNADFIKTCDTLVGYSPCRWPGSHLHVFQIHFVYQLFD